MIARLGLAGVVADEGARPLTADEGLAALRAVTARGDAQLAVVRADWPTVVDKVFAGAPPPLLERLRGERRGPASAGPSMLGDRGDLAAALAELPDAEQRRAALLAQLSALTARVLRLDPAQLDAAQPLAELGMDSIVALELKTWVEDKLDVPIPMADWLRGPSLATLAERIDERRFAAPGEAPAWTAAAGEPPTPAGTPTMGFAAVATAARSAP